MREIFGNLSDQLSDPDPVRRAQIQMLKPKAKRFYKLVTSAPDEDGGFAILLDGRSIKTPSKNKMVVPNEALAELLVAEWDAQKIEIDPATMPITRHVNSAIDGIADDVQAVLDDAARYANSDLLCYRAETPVELVQRQSDGWNPILKWAEGVLSSSFIVCNGIIHKDQKKNTLAAYGALVNQYRDPIQVAAFHSFVTLTGSAVLALAISQAHIDIDTAWALCHVDEDWSAEKWGEDAEVIKFRKIKWIDMVAANRIFCTYKIVC